LDQQAKNLIKEEIEKKLNEDFEDYNDAKDALFRSSEQRNISKNSNTLKIKYDNLKANSDRINKDYAKDLKLLQLRQREISSGNINNSQYGSIRVNGILLKDIRNINSININSYNIANLLGDNMARTHEYKNVRQKLYNLDAAFQNEIIRLKNNYYASFDDYTQLKLMQQQLDYENYKYCRRCYPFVLGREFSYSRLDISTKPVIENYAKSKRNGGTSIFSSYYDLYGYFYYLWLGRENRTEALYQVNRYKEYRENAIDELVGAVEIAWFLDNDSDGYHLQGSTAKYQNESPGNGWKIGTSKGEDCDDTNPLVWKSSSGLLGGLGTGETIVLGERGINENNLQLGTDEQSSFGTLTSPTLPQNIEAFRNAPSSGIEIDLNPFNGGDFGIHQSTVNLFELSDAVLEDYMRDTFELTGAIANTDGGNSLNLIMNHFLNGTGGVLDNGIISDMLTSGDGSTNNFSQTVGNLIESIRTTICNELAGDCIGDTIDFSNNFTPDFPNSDPILKAQLGGTQGLSIDVDSDGVVGINIYDTFGVDEADTIVTNGFFEETFQDIALGTRGLRAMWVLQHQRGAKPFVHKVRLNLENMAINEININDCN
jgi:hypothetical protein